MNRLCLTLSLVLLLAASGAKADDCFPLKRYASVDLLPARSGRPLIPVMIGDKPRVLILNTGGALSDITLDAAHDLGLVTMQSRVRIVNANGEEAQRYTYLPSLTIGGIVNTHVMFTIAPHNGAMEPGNDQVVGTLGPNILQKMDVDLDFGAHKVNFINPDHCEGKVVYWPAAAVAIVPMRLGSGETLIGPSSRLATANPIHASGHIFVPVMLDGKELNAEINTGSARTILNESVAERLFGFDPECARDAKVCRPFGKRRERAQSLQSPVRRLDVRGRRHQQSGNLHHAGSDQEKSARHARHGKFACGHQRDAGPCRYYAGHDGIEQASRLYRV